MRIFGVVLTFAQGRSTELIASPQKLCDSKEITMHQHGHDDPNAKKLYELIKDVKIAMMTTAEGGKAAYPTMYNMEPDETRRPLVLYPDRLGEDAGTLSRQRGQPGLLGPVQPDLRGRDRQGRNRPGQGQDRREMVGAA